MTLDDPLTLKVLMDGMTHFVDIGAADPAAMFYEPSGRAHIRLPDGHVMHGSWTPTRTGYDVAWENGPTGSWAFAYEPGRISYVDGDGKNHGPIVRIEPGDAANIGI
ncbi:MAG: hypothetical protein H6873_04475 [Hyphomicrobiaceae bacterium]|nr:hypothetical protein [Hyphomicrobiaceae bacterium]